MMMVPKLYNEEWCEEERKVFRDWVKSHLVYGPVTVYFVKKDGTERKMICTLKSDLVEEYEKKTDRTKTLSEETCPVFDLEKQEWRSFRFDAVTKVEFSINESN
jgi:hypothetical protein